MEWDKIRLGQSVRAIRVLSVKQESEPHSLDIPIGTIGVVRDVHRPGNNLVPAIQVEWQVESRPHHWCGGFEIEPV